MKKKKKIHIKHLKYDDHKIVYWQSMSDCIASLSFFPYGNSMPSWLHLHTTRKKQLEHNVPLWDLKTICLFQCSGKLTWQACLETDMFVLISPRWPCCRSQSNTISLITIQYIALCSFLTLEISKPCKVISQVAHKIHNHRQLSYQPNNIGKQGTWSDTQPWF